MAVSKLRYASDDTAPWEQVSRLLASAREKYSIILRDDEVLSDAVAMLGERILEAWEGRADALLLDSVPAGKLKKIRSGRDLRGYKVCPVHTGQADSIMETPGCICALLVRTAVLKEETIDGTYGAGWLEELSCRILMKREVFLYGKGLWFGCISPLHPEGGADPRLSDKRWYLSMLQEYLLPWMSAGARSGQTEAAAMTASGEAGFRAGICDRIPILVQAQLLQVLHVIFWKNRNNLDKKVFSGEERQRFTACAFHMVKDLPWDLVAKNDRKHAQRRIPVLEQAVWADQVKQAEFPVILRRMEVENGMLCMDFCAPGKAEDKIAAVWNKEALPLPVKKIPCYSGAAYFGEEYPLYLFQINLPFSVLEKKNQLTFCVDGKPLPLLTEGYISRISSMVRGSWWTFSADTRTGSGKSSRHSFMVSFAEKQDRREALRICTAGRLRMAGQEIGLLARIPFGAQRSRKMFVQRLQYWIAWPLWHKRSLWLTFDKLYKGGDCGEYFFRYAWDRFREAADQKNCPRPVYVIRKNTADGHRLEESGYPPVYYGTLRQRLSFFYAEIVFATHSSPALFNGYNSWEIQFIQDRLKSVNVCIQHGLSIQDLTFDSNRLVSNNKRYYCASRHEIENLSRPKYDYGPDVLKLTGIPRFDGLKNQDRRIVLIAPTWRSYLAMPAAPGKTRPYNPDFRDSAYYRLFQELISSRRLLDTAKKYGYRTVFLLHPVFSAQLDDFSAPDGVEILASAKEGYEKLLTTASLMVTDYSGVQFDFAYMGKPVIYFHPPQLPPHYESDAFDYETDGFGPVCTTLQSLTETICRYMEKDCVQEDVYRKRIRDFYAYEDHENCRRIYEDARRLREERCSG